MDCELPHLARQNHRLLIEEYQALDSNEERLEWLMEREPIHAPVPEDLVTAERRVPGCLSGLWLHGSVLDGVCYYSAKSDSAMVQGIASFVCDLYSERPPQEVIEVAESLAQLLGLERLLSATRKRAVSSTVAYILHTARISSFS
jgi:cysteine desulfuration protein SufE